MHSLINGCVTYIYIHHVYALAFTNNFYKYRQLDYQIILDVAQSDVIHSLINFNFYINHFKISLKKIKCSFKLICSHLHQKWEVMQQTTNGNTSKINMS